MNLSEWNVGVERLVRGSVAPDELHRSARDFRVHGAAAIHIQHRDLSRFFPLAGFINMLRVNYLCVPSLLVSDRRPHASRLVQRWPHCFVVGARNAIPLIKPLIGGHPVFGAAKMPFAPHPRCVALRRQQLRGRNLPLGQSIGNTADRDFVGTGADGEAPREQR